MATGVGLLQSTCGMRIVIVRPSLRLGLASASCLCYVKHEYKRFTLILCQGKSYDFIEVFANLHDFFIFYNQRLLSFVWRLCWL